MKIAYVLNTYPRPSHSFIRREISALENRGHEILRIAMRRDAGTLVDPDDQAEDGLTTRVLEAPKAQLLSSLWRAVVLQPKRFLGALRLALACGKRGAGGVPGTGGRMRHMIYLLEAAHVAHLARSQEAQHLHAHFGTNSATVAMLAAELTGLPFSFTAHGPEEFDAPRALSLGEKADRASFTVAISSFGRSQLMRWTGFAHWPRLKVVHCGIVPSRFAKPSPLPSGAGHMVAIGRLSEQKGQMLLLEALALALPRAPELQLTLVGDGELRGPLEAAVKRLGIASHVHFAGWLDEAGVRNALANCHTLVLPSFAEGLPMVVMEAMAAARPVIATSIAGVPELVIPHETGWLVPAGDALALAEAMFAFAATPSEVLTAMGARGRSRVLSRHDIAQEAEKLEKLFLNARASNPPRTA